MTEYKFKLKNKVEVVRTVKGMAVFRGARGRVVMIDPARTAPYQVKFTRPVLDDVRYWKSMWFLESELEGI